jgi:hypothetical protein
MRRGVDQSQIWKHGAQGKVYHYSFSSEPSPETMEMLELLRHWWVNNIIAQRRGGERQHRKRKPIEMVGSDSDVKTPQATARDYPIRQVDDDIGL